MSKRVILTPRAEAELANIADWWAEHQSSQQAIRWYDEFSDALFQLADFTERCPLARENRKFSDEIRELHFGLGSRPTHRAIFTIRPDAVVVLTIRHLAQDDVDDLL